MVAESDSSSAMYTTRRLSTIGSLSLASRQDIYREGEKGSLAEPLGFYQLESW